MPGPDRLRYVADAFRAGLTLDEVAPRLAHRSLVPRADRGPGARGGGGRAEAASRRLDAARLRALKRKGFADSRLAQLDGHDASRPCASAATASACARSTSASTPARPNSRRRPPTSTRPTRRSARRRPTAQAQDHDPGRRAEPHRPGHRVRLLLRARGARAARGRVRDHHGQLQSGDRLDGLRHLRPPVLRAAHVRGRDGDRRTSRSRSASSCSTAARRR